MKSAFFGLALLPIAVAVHAQDEANVSSAREITEEEIAAIEMPDLAFKETDRTAYNYIKYFYFHRDDTTLQEAFDDLLECDALSSGLISDRSYSADSATTAYYATTAGVGGVIGSAIGNFLSETFIGSADRRRMRRTNMRNCMGFKGYDRYGLKKSLWSEFNFEEGNGREEESVRRAKLLQQALVASGPKPEQEPLGNMRQRILSFAAVLAMLVPGNAFAKDEEAPKTESIEAKKLEAGEQAIDLSRGYIYLTAPRRWLGTFVRVPDEEDVAAYKSYLDKEFAEFETRRDKEIAEWEEDAAEAKRNGQEAPERPELTFKIAPIESRNAVEVGPLYRFDKLHNGDYAYLQAVKPGRYIWYGPIATDLTVGRQGVCYCMGTVSFEVPAGAITDLGNFLWAAPRAEDQPTAEFDEMWVAAGLGPGTKIRFPEKSAEVVYGLPEALADVPVQQADFRAHGKMDNYFGLQISRLPPVDGVLAYDRDRVIDLKEGQ